MTNVVFLYIGSVTVTTTVAIPLMSKIVLATANRIRHGFGAKMRHVVFLQIGSVTVTTTVAIPLMSKIVLATANRIRHGFGAKMRQVVFLQIGSVTVTTTVAIPLMNYFAVMRTVQSRCGSATTEVVFIKGIAVMVSPIVETLPTNTTAVRHAVLVQNRTVIP